MTPDEEITELKAQQSGLSIAKREIELKIIETKNRLRTSGRLPNDVYAKLCGEMSAMGGQIFDIEKRGAAIKNRLRQIANEQSVLRKGVAEVSDAKKSMTIALVELRDYYQKFSADGTRVSSMRTMASEFVIKLNPIIRNAVNNRAVEAAGGGR